MAKQNRMAGAKKIDLTPNEHMISAQKNFDNSNYATDNPYGVDLSGIKYKAGIEDYYGGDASVGGNDVTAMLEAGYSADDIYNFTKARGLNYNKHGREYLQREGDYDIGYGSDQWGDILGYNKVNDVDDVDEIVEDIESVTPIKNVSPFPASSPVQTITTNPFPDEVAFVPNLGGGGFDFDQTLKVNQNNDINSYINGDNNSLNNYQYNGINNEAFGDTDGLYAQRDPEGFKNLFMKNFFN